MYFQYSVLIYWLTDLKIHIRNEMLIETIGNSEKSEPQMRFEPTTTPTGVSSSSVVRASDYVFYLTPRGGFKYFDDGKF